jgi:MOSC domain-containing protein YiiM
VRRGTVLAVCWSPTLDRGVGKAPREAGRITRWGIPGDRHHGEFDSKRGAPAPNDRPITVVAAEAVRAACADLGLPELAPGSLGENLLVEGLGDLSDLVAGDRLLVAPPDAAAGVELVVTEQNRPCKNLCAWHRDLPAALRGRRGVICVVHSEGEVKPGFRVEG